MCEKNGWTKTLRGMTKFGAVAERNKTMSVRDIELFTEITGDRNPLHNDDKRTNLLIVGAGPFGLAMAAYARHLGIEHLIVGKPMAFWKANMPKGMHLRSACDWHLDPMDVDTIEKFLETKGLRPRDVEPLSLEFYLSYAQWFQEQKEILVLPALVQNLDWDDHWHVSVPRCYG